MKLFENFERLKSLILNKHQIYAFDNFMKRDLTDIYTDKTDSIFELFKYFNGNQRISRNLNLIPDEKIKKLLDQDLKNLLNI